MEINTYSGNEIVKKEINFVASTIAMKKYENARKVLPTDTTYALVAEIVEREIDEPLDELDIVTTLGIPTGFDSSFDGGLRGRFISYISIGGNKLRIHNQDGRPVFEEILSNLQVDTVKTKHLVGNYVIQNAAKKFVIHPVAVIDPNPDFKSIITPKKPGISPLFDLMADGGSSIKLMSEEEQRKYYLGGLKVFLIIASVMVAVPVVFIAILLLASH